MKTSRKVCITGGTGFFGRNLASSLHEKGYQPILLLDFEPPSPETPLPPFTKFILVDVRDIDSLEHAFRECSIVFHVASYGMSGSSQLRPSMIKDINVNGTQNVIDAAIKCGVQRLVFTSSYNVCFGGQSIDAGDESIPYFPLHKHTDEYSRTKTIAEQLVLQSNMTPLVRPNSHSHYKGERHAMVTRQHRSALLQASNNEETVPAKENRTRKRQETLYLRTCAIRPAAIWGYSEQRHFPRVVKYLEMGLLQFIFGKRTAKMDFVHVKNLVQAHILAAECLTESKKYKSAGQAYFISDGEDKSINNFEFFKFLILGLGFSYPKIRLPLWLVYFVAHITEILHRYLHPYIVFEPFLTRTEVLKAGINHWFVMKKARNELQYAPLEYDYEEMARYFVERGHHRRDTKLRNSSRGKIYYYYYGLIVVSMVMLYFSRLYCWFLSANK